MTNTIQTFERRFIVVDSGCWEWMGRIQPDGYGRFAWKGREGYVHRFSWVFYRGKIPAGLLVLHKCDNRSCVNPDHLFVGTQQDNVDDMYRKGRGLTGKKRGPRSKEYKTLQSQLAHQRMQDPNFRALIGKRSGAARLGKPRGPYKKNLA